MNPHFRRKVAPSPKSGISSNQRWVALYTVKQHYREDWIPDQSVFEECSRSGRISVFVGVTLEDVREEQMPASIAPERFQTH